jgi:hypothetical protein
MPPEFDEVRDDAIDRFWDQIARNQSNAAGGLDPADAAAIRHLHVFDDRPGPNRVFRKRLREELMHAHAIPVSSDPSSPFLPNRQTGQPQRVPAIPQSRVSRRGSWALAQLATAALLLLTLGLGYLAVKPGGSPGQLAGIPAILATPDQRVPATSPAAEASLQTIFAMTLPEDALPSGPSLDIAIKPFALEPAVRAVSSAEQRDCCPGSEINHVISGDLTLQVDGPLRVVRAGSGGTPEVTEDVPPGTAVILRPGDSAVFRFESAVQYANAGATRVQFVRGVLIPNTGSLPVPQGILDIWGDDVAYPAPIPPLGSVRVELGRVTLEPEGILAGPPAGGYRVAIAAKGGVSLAERSNGSFRNPTSEPVELVVMTVIPTA